MVHGQSLVHQVLLGRGSGQERCAARYSSSGAGIAIPGGLGSTDGVASVATNTPTSAIAPPIALTGSSGSPSSRAKT